MNSKFFPHIEHGLRQLVGVVPDVAPARAEREFPHSHAQRHDLLTVEPERLRALGQIRREALLRHGAGVRDAHVHDVRPCMVHNCFHMVARGVALCLAVLRHHIQYQCLHGAAAPDRIRDAVHKEIWDDARIEAPRPEDDEIGPGNGLQTVRQRLRVLLSWVLAGAVIQAAVILAVNAGVVLMDDPAPLCRWLNEHAVGIVDVVSARLVRVFFKSSPYMVVACVIALFRQAQAPKLRWRYVLAVSLLLCALLLSFTRSLYGALGLTAVLSITAVLILCPAGRKRVLAFLLAVVVCFGVMSTVQEIVLEGSYLSFAVSRTVGREIPASWASQLRQRLRGDTPGNQPDSSEMDSQRSYIEVTERSDQLRQETKDGLKVYIRRSPVIGCGLGASAANREKGVDEYFYLDMLARTGIVGLVLYILPFGYVVLWCLRRRSLLRECPEGAAVVCGLCTFWVVTWFNPWMNAVLGIAWYAVTLSVPQALEEQNA